MRLIILKELQELLGGITRGGDGGEAPVGQESGFVGFEGQDAAFCGSVAGAGVGGVG